MKNENIFLSLTLVLTGVYRPRTPSALKALSDFRIAKVPGPGGRLMAAY